MAITALSPEQKERRKFRVTGSTAAGILGRSPYGPPSLACAVQRGEAEVEENAAMRYGNIFEGAIRVAAQEDFLRGRIPYSKEPDVYERVELSDSVFHAKHDWLVVHPDGIFPDAREGIQIKNHDPGIRFPGRPGSECGNDAIPEHHLIQCQIEMETWRSVHGSQWKIWWLPVYQGGARLKLYRVMYDYELARDLLIVLEDLWHRHINPEGPLEPVDDSLWKAWMDGTKEKTPPRRVSAEELVSSAPVNLNSLA